MRADWAERQLSTLRVVAGAASAVAAVAALTSMPRLTLGVVIGGVLFLCMALLTIASRLFSALLRESDGGSALRTVAEAIQEGSEGFMKTQYMAIFQLSIVVGVLLFVASWASHEGTMAKALLTAASFFTGAALSGVAGYTALAVSVRINVRVAAAATRHDYPASFAMALRGGLVCGMLNVSLCVAGLAWMLVLASIVLGNFAKAPAAIVGYGFGASLVALFAQLGGGIYTKAADVGADLVGKVETLIPEDDPRNPAVIADLVGDNVGDCAGRGADLFESIAAEQLGAMVLGGALAAQHGGGFVAGDAWRLILFPLAIHTMDVVISAIAVLVLRVKTTKSPRASPTHDLMERGVSGAEGACGGAEDPLTTLERGYATALVMSLVGIAILSRILLHTEQAPSAWMAFTACGWLGVGTSFAFVAFTKHYTDYRYAPVQRIALASTTGHGTNVIAGLAVGLESTAAPALTCGVVLVAAFGLGSASGAGGNGGAFLGGLFGTAVTTMGMLSTAVYVLAMDTFGPITDNAGGIVEMSGGSEVARIITDRLDAVGNVTKATTKGYSVGAATLAAFLLLRAYLDVVEDITHIPVRVVNFATPEVYVAALYGGTLIFVFSGWAMSSVGRAATEVVTEVRRQFAERPGILDNTARPDYHRCVSIVTQAALIEMRAPGMLALLSPIAVGVGFRFYGQATGQPLLGVIAVSGMLLMATATGALMALFFNNAGGAFDNAKKYIEGGSYGGKRGLAHQAAVTGDTLGDPLKDTVGPSIHVLMKLLSTVALVACPLFVP